MKETIKAIIEDHFVSLIFLTLRLRELEAQLPTKLWGTMAGARWNVLDGDMSGARLACCGYDGAHAETGEVVADFITETLNALPNLLDELERLQSALKFAQDGNEKAREALDIRAKEASEPTISIDPMERIIPSNVTIDEAYRYEKKIKQLNDQLAEAKEVLEFYGSVVFEDKGEKARALLKKWGEG